MALLPSQCRNGRTTTSDVLRNGIKFSTARETSALLNGRLQCSGQGRFTTAGNKTNSQQEFAALQLASQPLRHRLLRQHR
jgi:hypothetical protein